MPNPDVQPFVPLERVTNRVVDDFVPLLSELSSSFAKMPEDKQRTAVCQNLEAAVNNPSATVFVHYDTDTGRIISTATANWDKEGWVDDVVTLEQARGRGLGGMAMNALHGCFAENNVTVVRLTSSLGRAAAGNLYAKLGYQEGGDVWRAPLNEQTANFSQAANGLFTTNNCTIPIGNKAWVSGPDHSIDIDPSQLEKGLTHANYMLWQEGDTGITSANYFSETPTSPGIAIALKLAGYAQRPTRLYTLQTNQPL